MGGFQQFFISLFICSIFLVQNGYAKLIPDYIHPCSEDDQECLLKSTRETLPEFVKGIPELGVPSLDPFIIQKLSIPLNGLKISFYNGKVTGIKKCVIENVHSDLKKHRFTIEFRCNITLKGGYDANGRVLLFPINGEGDAKIKLTNLRMKVNLFTKYATDDQGVTHYAVKNYKYDFDYGDKVTFNLTNLFKDNPEISNTILVFLNENWRQVADEFGKPIMDYTVELAVRTIEKFFLAVPYEELIDGPAPRYD